MLVFRIHQEGQFVREFRAAAELISVGRDPESDIHLPDSRISRNQAQLRRSKDGYWWEDLSSESETRLNGTVLSELEADPLIGPGDTVALASFTLEASGYVQPELAETDDELCYLSEAEACRILQKPPSDVHALAETGNIRHLVVMDRPVYAKPDLFEIRASAQGHTTVRMERSQDGADDGLLPISEIALITDVPEHRLNELIVSGELRAYRDQGDVKLRPAEVIEFLAQVSSQAAPDPETSGDEAGDRDGESGDLIALEDVATLLGMDVDDVTAMLADGPLRPIPRPGRPVAVKRAELARLVIGSATRASLLQAEGDTWDRGEPQSVVGENDHPENLEEQEDDPTEETSEGRPPPPEPAVQRGALTIRFFDRMALHRSYPLIVEGSRLGAPVTVVPRFPGCLAVPDRITLAPGSARGEIWITPQALGTVPSAYLEAHLDGGDILEVRLPLNVGTLAPAMWLLVLSGLLLLAGLTFEALEPAIAADTILGQFLHALGGGVPVGILLSVCAFLAGTALFFLHHPREGRALSASLTGRGADPN